MPFLRFRAIEAKDICTISTKLVDELEELLKCPRAYLSLEAVTSTFIRDGAFANGEPLVEVSLFPRPQETEEKIAQIITKHLQSVGYKNLDVTFTLLDHDKYYENGKLFK